MVEDADSYRGPWVPSGDRHPGDTRRRFGTAFAGPDEAAMIGKIPCGADLSRATFGWLPIVFEERSAIRQRLATGRGVQP